MATAVIGSEELATSQPAPVRCRWRRRRAAWPGPPARAPRPPAARRGRGSSRRRPWSSRLWSSSAFAAATTASRSPSTAAARGGPAVGTAPSTSAVAPHEVVESVSTYGPGADGQRPAPVGGRDRIGDVRELSSGATPGRPGRRRCGRRRRPRLVRHGRRDGRAVGPSRAPRRPRGRARCAARAGRSSRAPAPVPARRGRARPGRPPLSTTAERPSRANPVTHPSGCTCGRCRAARSGSSSGRRRPASCPPSRSRRRPPGTRSGAAGGWCRAERQRGGGCQDPGAQHLHSLRR